MSTRQKSDRPPASLNGADWRTSAAKRLIAQDMIDGLVPFDTKIRDIQRLYQEFYSHQPEFADFPYDEERYKQRIARIQTAVRRLHWASNYDKEALDEFRNKYPQQTHGPTGKPLWKDSEADAWLKQDMKDGLHLQMPPRELFETRDCYKPFGKRRFAKRIDQLRQAAKPYGTNPMQAAAKREKKELTQIKDRPSILAELPP